MKRNYSLLRIMALSAALLMVLTSFTSCDLFSGSGSIFGASTEKLNEQKSSAIGYGYNALTGNISTPSVCQESILDMDKVAAAGIQVRVSSLENNGTTNLFEAASLSEMGEAYSETIGVEIGARIPIKMFTVGVSEKFATTNSTASQTAKSHLFQIYSSQITTDKVSLSGASGSLGAKKLTDCLSPLLQDYFNELASSRTEELARELFNVFGTHLVTAYSVGGRLEVANHVYTQSVIDTELLSENAGLGLSVGVGRLSVSGSIVNNQTHQISIGNKTATSEVKINILGGSSSYTNTAELTNDAYENWISSLNQNAAIVELTELIPIWELTNDVESRFLLESVFDAECERIRQEYEEAMRAAEARNAPVVLSSYEDLQKIRENPDGTFVLGSSIDCHGEHWIPIPSFEGVLDGASYVLENFTCVQNNVGCFGLFESNNGTIRDLNIFGCKIINNDPDVTGDMSAGILCGVNNGLIVSVSADGCDVQCDVGKISTDANSCVRCGILCGRNAGTIRSVTVMNSRVSLYAGTKYQEAQGYGGAIAGDCIGGKITDVSSFNNEIEVTTKANVERYLIETAHGRPRAYNGAIVGYADSAVLGGMNESGNTLITRTERNCSHNTDIDFHQGGAVGFEKGCTHSD